MNQPRLKLYHYWRSSSSWRVRWALALKGFDCEYVAVNLLDDETDRPEHRARNPMGYVPVLEIPGPSGGTELLSESLAIIDWLETARSSPSLYPRDALARARAIQLAEIVNAGTQPLQNINVQDRISSDPEERKRWAQFWIEKGLAAYEAWVIRSAGKFSVGDELSVADLCLVPQCYNAERNDVAVDRYPTIARIRTAALQTESCQASAPDRFKPA